jgi:hypothetical protein
LSIVSATVDITGTQLAVEFDHAAVFGAGGDDGFVLTLTGGAAGLTYVGGAGTATLTYSIARTVSPAETGTLAYTQPGDGVESIAGADLLSFSGQTVTNNSEAAAPVVEVAITVDTFIDEDGDTQYAKYYGFFGVPDDFPPPMGAVDPTTLAGLPILGIYYFENYEEGGDSLLRVALDEADSPQGRFTSITIPGGATFATVDAGQQLGDYTIWQWFASLEDAGDLITESAVTVSFELP